MSALVTDLLGQKVRIRGRDGVIRAVFDGGPGEGLRCIAVGENGWPFSGTLLSDVLILPAWSRGPWVNDGSEEAAERVRAGLSKVFPDAVLVVMRVDGALLIRWSVEPDKNAYVVPVGHRVGINLDTYIEVAP